MRRGARQHSRSAPVAPAVAVALGAVLLLTGCTRAEDAGPGAGGRGTDTSTSRPAATVVRVGDAPPLRVEVAATEAARARGLMERSSVPPGTGMAFVFPERTTTAFYMFRTRVPLSIAFVDEGRVVSTAEMRPCPSTVATQCPLYSPGAPYTLAVEAAAGTFASVSPGDRVTVDGPLPAGQ